LKKFNKWKFLKIISAVSIVASNLAVENFCQLVVYEPEIPKVLKDMSK